MAQQFKVIVNTGKEDSAQTLQAEQGAGQRGRPLIIKAKAGAKYQLVEVGKSDDRAPDNIKAKRVGKHLHLMFEADTVADVIIEDYYDVMAEGYNGVIGKAENGRYYEYLTEDPTDPGLIPLLSDNATAVTQALGGAEVTPVAAAVAVAAFPLLGALGLLGGAAALIAADNDTTTGITGALQATAPNDSGTLGDNRTNDNTPTLVGKVPAGSTATVTINGQTYPVTVAPDGSWTFTQPTNLPDGTYTPILNVTQNGVTTQAPLTPFVIDTVTNVDITNPGKVGATDPISGTAEPGDTVVVKDASGKVIGTTTAGPDGKWSVTPTSALPAGPITATATDAAGNTATDTENLGNNSSKTALTIDPISTDNVLLQNEQGAANYPVTGKVTGKFAAGDAVQLTLNGKTYATTVDANGAYSINVPMADLLADPDTKIEGVVTGTGGDTATAAQDYTTEPTNTPTKTALSINPVTADNILSAAENNGNITLTGKVTGKYAAGDVVTLTVNGKTFTGAAAADGSYSIAVPASDLAADSDTIVNGTVNGTGGTKADAIQDYGLDITVPNGVKTALTIEPISADNVLLASEAGAATVPVTGKVTGQFAAGDLVTLSLNGKLYTAPVAADGSYTVNLSTADLKADPDTKIEGSITGTGGDTATAAQDYTLEAGETKTQTALSINPVTADNILSAAETTGNIAITGKVTGKYAAGDVVTLTVNGKTFTGAAAADGSYSIPVPASDLAADSDTIVDGSVAGTGGTQAKAIQDYGLGVNNTAVTGKLAPVSDNTTGTPNDNKTNDPTPDLTGTAPVGSTAVVSVNGVDYPVAVQPDGTWAFTQPTNLPDGTYYPVLKVTQNGVTTPHNLTPFTIDTTPPTVEVKANTTALANGQMATITFTLSEASSDFTWNGTSGDIVVTGGTLSALTQSTTDPKVYTATFTPTPGGAANSTATISVASDKFADAAGNRNQDTATNPAPAGALYEANNSVNFKTNATVTGALDPNATNPNGTPNDSGVKGDNLTNDPTPTLVGKVPAGSTATVTLNGQTLPATVNPDGTWSYTQPTGLPDGTYTPQLNVTTGGVTTTTPITPFTIDTTPPTIEVKADTSVLTVGETATVTFVLSEPVSDFRATDITTTGGTLSALTQSATDPKVWTATFTPASTGTTATISVASGKFSDAAANLNTDGAEANNTVSLATNATVSGSLAPVSDNTTGTPNDNKTNDPTPELTGTVPAGSTATVTINGQTYPVDVKPDGTYTFTQPTNLPDGTYTPVLNVSTGGQTQSTPITPFTIDTTPPSIAVSTNVGSLSAGQNATITFTLSEPVSDFSSADISVSGGSLGPLVQSATDLKVYTALFTPTTTGTTATVSVASNKFTDAAGNNNIDTATNPAPTGAVYETNNAVTLATNANAPVTTPTGALDPVSDSGVQGDNKTNDPTPTITGKVPAGSTATITLDGKTYPVDVKPDGSYSFTPPTGLPDGTYTPQLNVTQNGTTSTTPITPFTIDTVPPTITITADKTQLLAGQTTVVTFTVNEAVSDFVAADIKATGGTLGALTHVGVNSSGQDVYTAVFTPTAGSTATSVITVGSGKFSDAANNFNTDGDEANNTLMLPTNTVVGGGTGFLAPNSDSGTPGDNVTNDDTPTITGKVPPGSTASVNINGKDYPVTVNPDGSYSYTIPDGLPDGTYTPKIKVTPPGGGTPVESDGTPFTIDTTAPTILVSSDKTSLSTGQTATITFTLSEDSTDFTLADVTATGGTLSNLQGSGKVYTATFTPSANSTTTSTVKVDNLKFSDAAGNFNVDGADTGVANTNIVSMTTNTTVPDTTAPTIAISADRSSLATGQTTLITFTLSEASSNFTAADVTLSSGALSGFAQSPTNPLVYTATYTPAAGSTATSVISVASNKFTDAAGNNNADGADANNTVSLPTNTTPGLVTGALDPKSDTGTPGDNKTLDNTPTISGTAPPGSEVEIVIPGQNGQPDTVVKGKADENGQYSINVPNSLTDGTYTPQIKVTPPGGSTSNTDGTPFTIDTTAPTILVASDKTSLSAGQTATITFTLSEANSDFTQADIAVTGGTLSNWQGSGTSYTATFTPTANSTTNSVIHVASDKFSDAAGNFNADGADTGVTNTNTVSMVTNTLPADTTPPTIVVARTNPTAALKAGDTETITFTLSEASTSFNIGDIDTVGGMLSNFAAVPTSGTAATGYTQYTATFTPTAGLANGSATVGVAAGKFADNAGNANADTYVTGTGYEANNQVSLTYNTTTPDTTPPTVALSRSGTGTLAAGGSEVINIVLSEASKDFDLTDIVVTGGTLSGFAPVTASGNATTGYTDYVVTFTPNANTSGNATIGVLAGKFSDAANNLNKDTYTNPATGTDVYESNNLVSLAYNTTVPDTTAPTIAVSRSGLGTVSSTETIYFTLSEASTTFALDDIDATGGTLSNLVPVASSGTPATGYTQYAATFTPAANSSGVAAIGVASDKFTDAAGNQNKDTYLASVSGTTQEPNNAVSFNYNTVAPDNTAPTVAVSRSGSGIVTSSETITFTLSEASKDFALDDISVTGGTLAGLSPVLSSGSAATGYTEYTATFTPTSGTTGTATVGVASDKFSDAAGNFNKDTFAAGVSGTTQEVNNSVSFNYNNVAPDTTPPTIALARLGSGTLTTSETITFTLSEASKDFTLADIAVTGGTLSNLAAVPTSGTVGTGYTQYVATFTPTANSSGLATIGVASGKFSDAAGNLNQDTYTNPATAPAVYEANNKVEISYNTVSPVTDTTPPTVIVARAGSATLQSGNTETITFTLSEPSLTFDASDVTVSTGTLSNWTAVAASGTPSTGYTVYTATYTPAAGSSGTATIGVLSDKFTDAAQNLNKDTYATGQTGTTYEANNQVSVAYNTTQADKTAPKVEVLRAGSGTLTGPETIYFNFTEATTDFALEDITVSGGALSNLIAVTGSGNTQYTATFTPTAASTGTATIGVAAGKFSDAAGNLNDDTFDASTTNYEANNQVSIAYNTNATPADTTPPTVAISRAGTGTVNGTETLVFTFSEPITGFDASDILVTTTGAAPTAAVGTLGTVSAVAGSGNTQYTVTYTAPAASVGSVTFGVKAGAFTDTASTPNANKDTYETGVANTVQEANNALTLAWDTDTTAPTVAVTSTTATGTTLGVSQTSTITFTLSEASADFTQSDITVTGGTLSNWTKTSDIVYTATFTPTPNNSGTATIGVVANKFSDLGGNFNADDYNNSGTENTNNKVDIAYNTLGATFTVNNDTNTVAEDGSAITGNVKTNDSLVASVTSVSQGSTSGTLGTALVGTYGSLVLNADGSYTYTIDNTKSAVQALKAGQQVTEVFSYTGANTGATQSGSANLVITINGTNDAPVAVADTATAVEKGGVSNAIAGTDPSGNVLTNDTDVDTGDTKTVSAISGGTVGTAKAGTYGSLTLNADGSYSYTLTQGNAAVEALLPTSTPLTDTFTYTVKDSANATHTATLTVSITGANDAPTVTAIADKTGTVGTALTPINVTSNFADVDTVANGETATYSAKLVDSSGNLVNGGNLPSWLQLDAATGIFTGTPPAGTAAGDIYIRATRTDKGGLSASDDFKITLAAAADTTPPTVAISSNQASLSSGQTAEITFTFSEAITGFVWDAANPSAATNDIEVSGGTLSALSSPTTNAQGQMVYTATFTPTANSTTNGVVKIAAGKFTDTATTPNANVDTYVSGANYEANNTVTLTVNTNVNSSLTLLNDTATIGEAGGVANGTAGSALASTTSGVTSLNVLGNDTAATSVTGIAAGSTAGTVGTALNGQYGTLTLQSNGSYTYTVNNSNATVNALQVGGSLTEVFTYTATDGTTSKTANLTVTINGTNDAPTVAVALVDQTGSAGTALSYTFDSGTFADVDTGDTKTYTATFADNTALSTTGWLSFDPTTRTFTGTPPAAGTYSVKVTCTDSQSATVSDIFDIVVTSATDTTPPTIAVTRSGTGTMTAAETITFTLSEVSTDFASADVDVTGGTLSNFTGSGTTYTALFTPTANFVGSASVGVKAGKFSDAATNSNTDTYEPFISGTVMEANNIVNMDVITDVTPPTIAISQITSPVTGATTVTFTLSEASSDFTAADVYLTPGAGSLSNWTAVSGTVYTATFTPTANSSGNVTIGVAAGKFADAAGLSNKDTYDASADSVVGHVVESNNKTDFTFNTDVTPPTVAITGPSGAVNGPVTITFTLSEASSDFSLSAGDITVSGGGTLSNFQQSPSNPLVYTATYTPPATSTGAATIDIANGKFSDTAGNTNADGGDVNNHLPISYDTVTPTVEVTRATTHTLGGSGAPYTTELVTFTLSEASSDFTWNATNQTGSITVSGGTLGALTHVGVNSSGQDVYTATFTPTSGAAGTGYIGVQAGKFHDAAGNANADTYLSGQGSNTQAEGTAGANQVSVVYDTQAPTQTVSFGSMTKDSDISTGLNNDWQTADTSAGRLVSGFLSAPLAAGETLKVYSNGTLIGNAVVNSTGTAWEITDTTGYSANWTYTAKVVDAAGNPGTTATQAVTKLSAVSAATSGTSAGETVAYSTGTLDALAGDDTITVASTTIESDLGVGELINGGAGIDTLQLAAGTTLNLENLTAYQTVALIQEVEIFKMQGTSTLRMSANDVLSLGGANASTMAPFTFASTNQVADAVSGTAATGSTSSTGKVQMVIQGTSTDTLKLDSLLTDATVNLSNGVLGNAGLSGTWDYKGTVQVGLTTYKVYDHSTTNAQVLVDVPVIVNAIDPINITTIDDGLSNTTGTTGSNDTGTSATDFVTLDPTLVFKGTTPNLAAGEQVKFQLLNSSGQPVTLANGQTFAYLTPTGTNWTYDNTGSTLANGNYTIVATIVDSGGNVVNSYGSLGVDTQPLTIDTTLPTIVVTRATSNTLSAGQTETITFTLSEASSDFIANDVTVTNGTLINFSGSGTTYTATFVPASGSGTGTIKVDSNKFSDAAGNFNADGADTAAGITNIVSVAYQALPTQTVTFSSMTKDSGLATSSTNNHDWLTNDGSAGRLVSGTLDAPLTSGQTLKVYANGVLIGDAVVNGQAWEITDLTGYTANWTYTAKVVDSVGNAGPVATQVVNTDFTEAAPVITAVTDSASASIANNGTTTNTLSTVSGTGNAGDTIYLYDNTGTNLVGTTSVASNGTWSISVASSSGLAAGSNVFSARQVDVLGNSSGLSNLWTVSTSSNMLVNGDFTSGNTGFTNNMLYHSSPVSNVADNAYYVTGIGGSSYPATGNSTTNTTSTAVNYGFGSWSKTYVAGAAGNPDGAMTGNLMVGQVSTGPDLVTLWTENVAVTAGQTYVFKFDYANSNFTGTAMGVTIDGIYIQMVANQYESGHFTATYTAPTTKSLKLSVSAAMGGTQYGGGDYLLDNFSFKPDAPVADGTLTATGTPPFTASADGTSVAINYTGGAADMLDGNDVLNIGTNAQALLATSGNFINGSTGIDTLKLAAGTVLNLESLTTNQTVKPIEQVEVFTMQGSSALTLSANDVLSLGGANASTMSAYNFSTTTGGTASTGSTGKVQMVIHGTSSDTLVLDPLKTDGVTTNSTEGNTGLAGQWDYMGTTTANGASYKVYNHSTTGAQVLVDAAVNVSVVDPVVTNVVSFSSMTKDTSPTTAHADWTTGDASAGRLVSGTVSTPLGVGDVVKVYANGALIGDATVNAAGTAWEITDLNAYSANWTYTAQVVSAGKAGATAVQQVSYDNTGTAPMITIVTDTAGTTILDNRTTNNALSTVSGVGKAGDTIYLYDNTSTNLVGTTTVASNGTWSITGLNTNAGVGEGSNAFVARQVDAAGNSAVSNMVTVRSMYGNSLTNGDFSGAGGFTTGLQNTYPPLIQTWSDYVLGSLGAPNGIYYTKPTTNTSATAAYSFGTWSKQYLLPGGYFTNPDGSMTGNQMYGQLADGPVQTIWKASNVSVVAGKTYTFSFDYWENAFQGQGLTALIDGASITVVPVQAGSSGGEAGHFMATYVATTTKTITLELTGANGGQNYGDFALDNMLFAEPKTLADGSLGTLGSSSADAGLTYTAGALDAQAGDDTITATGTDLQAKLAVGGVISGGAGVDTLKLATGTVLSLESLTHNQTVKPIQQVEVVQMQANSVLTLSTNDVLSLGGSNTGTTVGASSAASPMAPFSFAATTQVTGATGSTSSLNKVQFVVQGTSSDTLALSDLQIDAVTTNGVVGNTGLAGQWDFKGTVVLTGVDGVSHTYKVYDQTTTKAQVLVDNAMNVVADESSTITTTATFSSMTKDSNAGNADWLTNDASAGRLVSGTLSAPLASGETLKVYGNGVLLGTATVNGQAWEITDPNGYSSNWAYTAQVVSGGKGGTMTTQVVTLDNTESAPIITAVTDVTNASVLSSGTTVYAINTVSGTGNAGDTLYLYDNASTNLVGVTTVGNDGTWTITGLATTIGAGASNFSARQIDTQGNQSAMSNLWTVTSSGNVFTNGDFTAGNTGFTSTLTYGTNANWDGSTNNYAVYSVPVTGAATTLTSNNNAYANGTWGKQYIAGWANPDSKISGNSIVANIYTVGTQTVWDTTATVVQGQTYTFKFDYLTGGYNTTSTTSLTVLIDGQSIPLVSTGTEAGHFTATYTATSSTSIHLAVTATRAVAGTGGGDIELDNFSFSASPPPATNTLAAGSALAGTSGADTVSFTAGALDAQAGNDTINVTTTSLQSVLATSGNFINGSTGIDTLKLAAGTTLDLTALTNNQTVKSIEQVEVFELQGSSTLTLSANNVLSLGQTNAFGTASTKVQLMIKGTSTDQVSLQNLLSDGVGGNAGLAGMWTKEASTVTVSGTGAGTYNVYAHSTTGAQVLISTAVPDSSVTLATSPLVLDLNGNGIETTTLAAGAVFDLDANGTAERAAWVAGGDGLLVRDLDGNGLIDNGAELFGSGTTLADGTKALDGFAALAGLDSNGDGVINASDAVFGQLQVWVDANGDAQTDAGELRSLADLGIASLDLHSQASTEVNNGNTVGLLGNYTTTDGAAHVLADVWLQNQSLPVLDLTQVLSDAQTATANLSNGQAELLRLNVSDILAVQANANGQHVVQITGDANDTVNLSSLLDTGTAQGTWQATGTVQQNGVTYNAYNNSADASLQVLVDQHLQHVTLS